MAQYYPLRVAFADVPILQESGLQRKFRIGWWDTCGAHAGHGSNLLDQVELECPKALVAV